MNTWPSCHFVVARFSADKVSTGSIELNNRGTKVAAPHQKAALELSTGDLASS